MAFPPCARKGLSLIAFPNQIDANAETTCLRNSSLTASATYPAAEIRALYAATLLVDLCTRQPLLVSRLPLRCLPTPPATLDAMQMELRKSPPIRATSPPPILLRYAPPAVKPMATPSPEQRWAINAGVRRLLMQLPAVIAWQIANAVRPVLEDLECVAALTDFRPGCRRRTIVLAMVPAAPTAVTQALGSILERV